MAEVRWIKITTDMFDNRKIKHLRKMPEGNNIVLIWVMLLTLAGRCNAGGMIFLTENIPYTSKMLADELDFEESTVHLAIDILSKFGMIQIAEDMISISNWEEYQNVEGLERVKEQNRIRKQRQREKEKLLLVNDVSRDCHVTSHQCHATDIDKDIDIEKDNISNDILLEQSKPKKPVRHKYGTYENVLLSDEQMEKLQSEFPFDWKERIERVSEYVASTGKKYKDYLATIRSWAKKETVKKTESQSDNVYLQILKENTSYGL